MDSSSYEKLPNAPSETPSNSEAKNYGDIHHLENIPSALHTQSAHRETAHDMSHLQTRIAVLENELKHLQIDKDKAEAANSVLLQYLAGEKSVSCHVAPVAGEGKTKNSAQLTKSEEKQQRLRTRLRHLQCELIKSRAQCRTLKGHHWIQRHSSSASTASMTVITSNLPHGGPGEHKDTQVNGNLLDMSDFDIIGRDSPLIATTSELGKCEQHIIKTLVDEFPIPPPQPIRLFAKSVSTSNGIPCNDSSRQNHSPQSTPSELSSVGMVNANAHSVLDGCSRPSITIAPQDSAIPPIMHVVSFESHSPINSDYPNSLPTATGPRTSRNDYVSRNSFPCRPCPPRRRSQYYPRTLYHDIDHAGGTGEVTLYDVSARRPLKRYDDLDYGTEGTTSFESPDASQETSTASALFVAAEIMKGTSDYRTLQLQTDSDIDTTATNQCGLASARSERADDDDDTINDLPAKTITSKSAIQDTKPQA